MHPEKELALKILDGSVKDRDVAFKALSDRGIDMSYFMQNPDYWSFIIGHKKQYKSLPTRKTFEKHFGITENIEVNEPIAFYMDKIAVHKRYRIVASAMDDADKLFENGSIDDGIAHLRSEIKRIDSTFVSKDLSIKNSVEERIKRYEYRMNNPGVDGIPSGLIRLDEATYGWHGGEFNLIQAYLGSYKCVSEYSLVRTVKGDIITLREFKNRGEKYIHSYNEETGKMVVSRVRNVVETGIKEGYKVKTSLGRETVVSDVHPYLTDDGWKKLKELKVGDRIALPRIMECTNENSGTLEEAWFLGLMLSEGSTTKGEACFSTGSSEVLIKAYSFAKLYNLEVVKTGKYDYRFSSKERYNPNYARELVRRFELAGCKSEDKYICSEALSWIKPAKAMLIKSLFDGDGSVGKNGKELQYTTASEKLAYGIQSILLEFGIISFCKKYINKFKGFYRISLNPDETKKFVNCMPKLIEEKQDKIFSGGNKNSYTDTVRLPEALINAMDDAVSSFGRKNFFNVEKTYGAKNMKTQGAGKSILGRRCRLLYQAKCLSSEHYKEIMYYVDREIYMDKVVSIEKVGKVKMLDLEVEGTHNFVVNNTIVHNTWTLLYMAKAAMEAGYKPLIATVEMGQHQIARRLDSILSKTEFEKIRSGRFTDQKDIDEFKLRMQQIKGMTECVVIGGVSFGELYLQAKIEEHEPDIVLVDGIYLMVDDDPFRRKAQWEQLNTISRGLKVMAENYNIPIVATTQAWKKSAKPGSKGDETTDDIAYSGGMAQNADNAVSLGRIYDPVAEAFTNRLWIKLTKLREGEPIKFQAQMDFSVMAMKEVLGINDARSGEYELEGADLEEGRDYNVGKSAASEDDDEIPF